MLNKIKPITFYKFLQFNLKPCLIPHLNSNQPLASQIFQKRLIWTYLRMNNEIKDS